MYLIDTNIFLEFFLKQKSSSLAREILKDLEENKSSFVVTNFTIHSIIVIAEKFDVLPEITSFFEKLLELENLFIHYLTLEEELFVLKTQFDEIQKQKTNSIAGFFS